MGLDATYSKFLSDKTQNSSESGFAPVFVPDYLFDFQREVLDWSVRKGRSAIFADCGLGKTPMQLVWAENVVRHTNGRVLIATPLAVSHQVIAEGEKFGIVVTRAGHGTLGGPGVYVCNYERLHLLDPSDFTGMVCDESSILKNFDGRRKAVVTEFMRKLPYRLLCTATAAPNDYIELGTSSEALGEMGHIDMLARFFKNDQHSNHPNRVWSGDKWRFRGHAEEPFWRWVCSWARAFRKPSDLGFCDERFELPPLTVHTHSVASRQKRAGMLFDLPAVGLHEQREERRRTITERCEEVCRLVDHKEQALVWCHLNDEGKMLGRSIDGAVEVSGSDSEESKEEKLIAFQSGEIRVLVTKPKIGAWGLNLQRCAHVTFFPSHSYEQYYQGIRRCWRFGQTRPVRVDVVASEGELAVMENLERKSKNADLMFDALVRHMNESMAIERTNDYTKRNEVPEWLSKTN